MEINSELHSLTIRKPRRTAKGFLNVEDAAGNLRLIPHKRPSIAIALKLKEKGNFTYMSSNARAAPKVDASALSEGSNVCV